MAGAPIPREVRRAFGPFLEAVRLLFRQETLELAGLLVVVSAWQWRGVRRAVGGPTITIPGWLTFPVEYLVLTCLEELLFVAAVLLLLPVARGERGLRGRLLLVHFGTVALAASIKFGTEWTGLVAIDWLEDNWVLFGGLPWDGILQSWLLIWAAWFLSRSIRGVGPRGPARAGLLAWPGLLAAAVTGLLIGLRFETGAAH